MFEKRHRTSDLPGGSDFCNEIGADSKAFRYETDYLV